MGMIIGSIGVCYWMIGVILTVMVISVFEENAKS